MALGVEVDLVVESLAAVYLEGDQQERQRCQSAEHLSPDIGSGDDDKGDDNVGEEDCDQESIEEGAPELTTRLGFCVEDVEEQILLKIAINDEVQCCDWEYQRLEGCEAEGDCCVKEEVVVAGSCKSEKGPQPPVKMEDLLVGIIEWRRSRPFN